ncbi:MAG: phosphatase PAP2 family protein [Bacteroidetes bacterium]|nr:MAG: phosphatase PAP2 family protein [Bacteroidota bacterium]
MIKLIVNIAFGLACLHATAQRAELTQYHRAQRAITAVMVHDILSPPVASRVYAYTNIAAYEAGRAGFSQLLPFQNQHRDFPRLKRPDSLSKVNAVYASAWAAMLTANRFVFSEAQLTDSINAILQNDWPTLPPRVKAQSIMWAKMVSDSVWNWSKKDNYRETRKLRRYSYGKADSMWKPTPPGYIDAVEPHWGKMKTVVLASVEEYRPALPMPFSTNKIAPFYQQAKEVYNKVNSLTSADSLIALFWDCNPFYLNTQGHLMFASKKLSPGGHWMSITGLACQQAQAELPKVITAYLLTSVALYDGFISCWHEKYRSNLIRPETYINAYIDEKWKPLLQTPPFPEYTSGHSVISTAAAEVLSAIFGNEFSYNDDTETGYGLPLRRFTSFKQAAAEAAISRFYGGIHYREAIEKGSLQGQKIGSAVIAFYNPHLKIINGPTPVKRRQSSNK